MERKITKKIR